MPSCCADAQKAKPGLKGNLMANVFLQSTVAEKDGKTREVRNLIGPMPAIPFEIMGAGPCGLPGTEKGAGRPECVKSATFLQRVCGFFSRRRHPGRPPTLDAAGTNYLWIISKVAGAVLRV